MFNNIIFKLIGLQGILMFLISTSFAQTPSTLLTAHYFDINKINKDKVHDVWRDFISIQYNDKYGQSNRISLAIVNWQRKEVGQAILQKDKGQNTYIIDLNDLLPQRDKNKVYTFRFTNEDQKQYDLLVRFVKAPEKNEITASIFVNPKFLNCNDEFAENLVEFLGSVGNGKAPYTVSWYVLNASRSDFLYQPQTQRMERPGQTASILVDKSPDYYVIMTVVDDCQSEQHQVVHVICEEGKKSINTVFFESITDFTRSKPQIN